MAEKAALTEKIGNIAKITMNNPTSLNSMTQALLGDIIDADRAFQIGLVNRVIADEQLWDETLDFARQLSRYAPLAIGLMKKILNQSDKLDLQAGIELETGIQLFCLGTEDHREGVNAFLEKRAPVFQGR